MIITRPANAGMTGVLHAISNWAAACKDLDPNAADCKSFQNHARDLSSQFNDNCNRENTPPKQAALPPSNEIEREFIIDLKNGLFDKDFKGWHPQQIADLLGCVQHHHQEWLNQCTLKKASATQKCSVGPQRGNIERGAYKVFQQRSLKIDFDEHCKNLFIDTGVKLGEGTDSTVYTAIELHPSGSPKWLPLALAIPKDTSEHALTTRQQINALTQSLPENKGLLRNTDANVKRSYMPRFETSYIDTLFPESEEVAPFSKFQHLRLAARGVDALHESGIVHRDLKPGNILGNTPHKDAFQAETAVADFGFAFKVQDQVKADKNMAKGTTGFLAPEQNKPHFLGDTADKKSNNAKSADVFSFAVMTAYSFSIAGDQLLALSKCQEKNNRENMDELCKKEFLALKDAVSKSKDHPELGAKLASAFDMDPSVRPSMKKLREIIDEGTQEGFVAEFASVFRKKYFEDLIKHPYMLQNNRENAQMVADEEGYAFYPVEDERGRLHFGLQLRGKSETIPLKENPAIDPTGFINSVQSHLGAKANP